mgnify:CR=1 FL=1
MYPWGDNRRFNSYAAYFRRTFGHRIQKVAVNAGFTCPNRDGTVGRGGCTFCDNAAFTPSYCTPAKSVTQQIDALEIMGVNSANYLILPKILGLVTIMPFLVIFSSALGVVGAYSTAYVGHIITPEDLTAGLQHDFVPWFLWTSIIKSLVYAYIITSVSSYFGYTVGGGSVEVGKASTAAVVNSSVLILFCDVFLTQLLS